MSKSQRSSWSSVSLWNSRKMSKETLFAILLLVGILGCSAVASASGIDGSDVEVNNKKEFEDFDLNTPAPVSHHHGGEKGSKVAVGGDADGPGMELGFIHAFIASLSVIVVSELGDKTFFIAAIMAMRHPRCIVFTGAIGALALMTVLSALFGYITTVIPRFITYYISTVLFAVFGFKMLYDGCKMSPDEGQEELEEVQAEIKSKDDDVESQSQTKEGGTEGYKLPAALRRILFACFSRVFLQAFTMTFMAEWGDRSQLATIILAAREDIPGVCIGGILGHSLCTGLAVLGGRMIAQKISVRTVTIIGGFVFLLFAVTSIFLNEVN